MCSALGLGLPTRRRWPSRDPRHSRLPDTCCIATHVADRLIWLTGSAVSVENVETLIIGGGQDGLSMSEQLSKRGLPHLIVERHRIAWRWRSERWDGLHANGPAWHDRLALMPIPGVDPDGFATSVQMVAYFVSFAERIAAPIRCGVEVTAPRKGAGRGFCAQTPS